MSFTFDALAIKQRLINGFPRRSLGHSFLVILLPQHPQPLALSSHPQESSPNTKHFPEWKELCHLDARNPSNQYEDAWSASDCHRVQCCILVSEPGTGLQP